MTEMLWINYKQSLRYKRAFDVGEFCAYPPIVYILIEKTNSLKN